MMINKKTFLIIISSLILWTSVFARSGNVKFGYKDQFTVFDKDGDAYAVFYTTLSDFESLIKKNTFEKKSDEKYTAIIIGKNEFYFSNTSTYIEKIILNDSLFFLSEDKLNLKKLSLEDLNLSYGTNAYRMFMSQIETEKKLNVTYNRDRFFMPFRKDEFPPNSKITFVFDYETMMCEKILIEFTY